MNFGRKVDTIVEARVANAVNTTAINARTIPKTMFPPVMPSTLIWKYASCMATHRP